MDIRNGMPASDLGPGGWAKPWSDNGGSCLEARKLPGGQVALRQSSDPDGPALTLSADEIRAFVEGAKAGRATGDKHMPGMDSMPASCMFGHVGNHPSSICIFLIQV